MSHHATWLVIYLGAVIVLAFAFVALMLIGFRSLRGRDSDLRYIRRYMESSSVYRCEIKRISNFARLFVGALFEVSNIARLYKATYNTDGTVKSVLFAFDDLSGKVKLKKGATWQVI